MEAIRLPSQREKAIESQRPRPRLWDKSRCGLHLVTDVVTLWQNSLVIPKWEFLCRKSAHSS
jgi:hypothetical protein